MIALIATIRTKEGADEAFEEAFLKLAAAVKANEAGCLLYQLTKSRTEPNTYKVMELYKDEDARKAHGQSDHFKSLGAAMGPSMAGRPEIETLDTVD